MFISKYHLKLQGESYFAEGIYRLLSTNVVIKASVTWSKLFPENKTTSLIQLLEYITNVHFPDNSLITD
jgi:hypothetical protein